MRCINSLLGVGHSLFGPLTSLFGSGDLPVPGRGTPA